jgi:hypothetical protein
VPLYTTPGIYLQELDPVSLGVERWVLPRHVPDEVARAPRPRWIAEHSTAAFVGLAARGPFNVPTLVTNWSKFWSEFGEFAPDGYLADAVRGFFLNGGRSCYVVRVEAAAPGPAGLTVESLIGDPADRTGLAGLQAVDDVSTVCIPDLMAAYQHGALDGEQVMAVQLALIGHCELMGERFAILDSPPALSARQVHQWRTQVAGYDSRSAALYYPWLRAPDPIEGTVRMVPPCGHVAGMYATNDILRGPHRMPANEVVRGALDVEHHLMLWEMNVLNPQGINPLVATAGQIRAWGSRTLSTDVRWRHIRATRLMGFVLRNLRGGTAWAILGPAGDERLWARLVRDIEDLLTLLWRSGALVGATPEEAFSVHCDERTNPPEAEDQIAVECAVSLSPGVTTAFRVLYVCD